MPVSRSMRPSSASCSTTTATNVLVALPMFHGTSGSIGSARRVERRRTATGLGDRAVGCAHRDAGADELTRGVVVGEDGLQLRLARRIGAPAWVRAAAVPWSSVSPRSSVAPQSSAVPGPDSSAVPAAVSPVAARSPRRPLRRPRAAVVVGRARCHAEQGADRGERRGGGGDPVPARSVRSGGGGCGDHGREHEDRARPRRRPGDRSRGVSAHPNGAPGVIPSEAIPPSGRRR